MQLWIRKENMSRADDSNKRITIGTLVIVRRVRGGVSQRVPGKVVASSTGSEYEAKKATGTTAAMLVDFPAVV